MAGQPQVMRRFTLPRPLWLMGWLSILAMAATVAATLSTACG